ncbi:nucleotidyltransferase domain-containing protein [Clostridium tagluense]|uniref:Uncharacterized protein n=1 Tax=Clostridium tagluense TaxID=360422 RepID=A0A401UQE6_9CLOT|nr:nucleotidyltransferase domain-containing protein [Clostridium tagluense]GCD11765.1 hypothetical protein Ctaglu_33880 [Clostridium tagluense]
MPNLEGRKYGFRALVGSWNYNLNEESSDRDYKLFLIPTFDDLYTNHQFSKSIIGELEDFDCHDIRKVSNLWWKANVNFLEVLFTEELLVNIELTSKSKHCINELFKNKDKIVIMNLPYLFNACVGMHITKKNDIDKGTEGTKHLIKMHGYETKMAMHSIRILDFLIRFANQGFKDFKKAIWYELDDPKRLLLLDIKHGKYTKEQYLEMATYMQNLVETEYKNFYMDKTVNIDTNEAILTLVKEIIKEELF